MSVFSPLFSMFEPIGVTLLLDERICDLGMKEDGEKLVGKGKEGCEAAVCKEQTWSLCDSLLTP